MKLMILTLNLEGFIKPEDIQFNLYSFFNI